VQVKIFMDRKESNKKIAATKKNFMELNKMSTMDNLEGRF
jgi:hypothetical protein